MPAPSEPDDIAIISEPSGDGASRTPGHEHVERQRGQRSASDDQQALALDQILERAEQALVEIVRAHEIER